MSHATASPHPASAQMLLPEIEAFQYQAQLIAQVFARNIEGINHEESLTRPKHAANCINWVVGHLVNVYNNAVELVGQPRLQDPSAYKRYERGAATLTDSSEAIPLDELLGAWKQLSSRFENGLASLDATRLNSPAPFSPTGNPNETVRSLTVTILFHQTYHVGQLGVLRRMLGKPGAIA